MTTPSHPAITRPPEQHRITRGAMSLRPTTSADLDFVVAVERHPDNAAHVEQWTSDWHRQALERPSTRHWIIEHTGHAVGYALLEGADDPNASLLLRRIAIVSKGHGHGRAAVLLVARYCFEELGFHRLWLTVAPGNRRALNLYRRLGFVKEGIARESVRKGDTFVSMHVFSMLDREYRASPQL